jgi:hypothetical protein
MHCLVTVEGLNVHVMPNLLWNLFVFPTYRYYHKLADMSYRHHASWSTARSVGHPWKTWMFTNAQSTLKSLCLFHLQILPQARWYVIRTTCIMKHRQIRGKEPHGSAVIRIHGNNNVVLICLIAHKDGISPSTREVCDLLSWYGIFFFFFSLSQNKQ